LQRVQVSFVVQKLMSSALRRPVPHYGLLHKGRRRRSLRSIAGISGFVDRVSGICFKICTYVVPPQSPNTKCTSLKLYRYKEMLIALFNKVEKRLLMLQKVEWCRQGSSRWLGNNIAGSVSRYFKIAVNKILSCCSVM